MTTPKPPEPSTTDAELAPPMSNEELAGLYARTHHGDYDELKAAALWGLRARDAEVERLETARKVHVEELHNADAEIAALKDEGNEEDDTPLDERCFRAGVKEGRRLEWQEATETAAQHYQPILDAKDKAVTDMATALAESERKAAGMGQLERLAKFWVSKVFCPYKAPELKAELAIEGMEEIRQAITPEPPTPQGASAEGE